MNVPLTRSDCPPGVEGLSRVTAVFCMVDGGKAYAAKNRSEAKLVNCELVAVIRNALRQVNPLKRVSLEASVLPILSRLVQPVSIPSMITIKSVL